MSTNCFLLIVLFLLGLYFYSTNRPNKEGMQNKTNQRQCPNMLIQKGKSFYLYNSKLAKVPGVNPIEFDNLEDYTEFLAWQRHQGIRCPVLYLQETYDAQGNPSFKVRPSVTEPQGGLQPSYDMPAGIASSDGNTIMESSLGNENTQAYPNPMLLVDAGRNNKPWNKNSFPAYDQSSFYVGTTTPLDAMNVLQENKKVSPDAMDPNWGGAKYTQSLIDKGYYEDDNVKIAVSS
jgi:hypothetical protein